MGKIYQPLIETLHENASSFKSPNNLNQRLDLLRECTIPIRSHSPEILVAVHIPSFCIELSFEFDKFAGECMNAGKFATGFLKCEVSLMKSFGHLLPTRMNRSTFAS